MKNKKIYILIISTILLCMNNAKADIFNDNNLNFFGEDGNKLKIIDESKQIIKNESINQKNIIGINKSINVQNIIELSDQEKKSLPIELIKKCRNIKKAILAVNADYSKKIKKEFEINEKVEFKKIGFNLVEINFFFSKDKICFNSNENKSSKLFDEIMSSINEYSLLLGKGGIIK